MTAGDSEYHYALSEPYSTEFESNSYNVLHPLSALVPCLCNPQLKNKA